MQTKFLSNLTLQESTRKFQECLKDEAGGEIIEEFVGLRAKLYAIKKLDGEVKKCKGVKRNVIRNKIPFNDYKDVLFSRKEVLRTMNVIRSRQHNLSTEQVNKIVLSANDDKRIIQPDKINTLAIGFRGGAPWEDKWGQNRGKGDKLGAQ